ncbi:MAG: SurA N-terminal domain-containing protein [Pseudomonadota bacterium]
MLLQIREKVSGWIAYGIIFLISIPFALFGVNSYFGGGEVPPAAIVNGDEVTLQDLDRAYANYRQRLSQLFGGRIPESFGTEVELRDQVLGQLIDEFAIRQYIDEHRYRVGDAALSRAIREMEVFHTDGQFDASRYQAQLRSIGASPLGFEQELRSNEAINQFRDGIQDTAFVIPQQAKQYSNLSNQSRKIRTVSYSADVSAIDVDDQAIEERYNILPDRFRTPEQLKIDYIEVSLDNIRESIVVDEASSFSRYQENLAGYTSAEIRNASHILIKVDDTVDSDTALGRISELDQRIKQGESFSDLASEFSEDPGSAADGGNLGEIERGIMVQAFENALFAMQPGDISEPIKTTFGWHLIKLHDVSGGESQSYESVRAEIESEIATELAESQIFELVDGLANLAYEQPDSLLPAAEQLELEVQTSDWFDRSSGTGITAIPKVRQAAYSDDVYQQGLNSEAIELDDNRVVFVRVNEVKASELQPLDEVRDQIRR